MTDKRGRSRRTEGKRVVDSGPAASQRREQKRATRDALRATALRLFIAQGFHETTVEQISATVGVTKRTFFLHFASKDEVLLGHITEQLDLLRALLVSPPADPQPFIRAGYAVTALAREMQARDDLLLQLDLLHRVPALLAAHLERFTAFEEAIGEAVKGWLRDTRQPLSEAENAYAQLVGTIAMAALRSGLIRWRRDGGKGSLARLVANHVTAIAGGMVPPSRSVPNARGTSRVTSLGLADE